MLAVGRISALSSPTIRLFGYSSGMSKTPWGHWQWTLVAVAASMCSIGLSVNPNLLKENSQIERWGMIFLTTAIAVGAAWAATTEGGES